MYKNKNCKHLFFSIILSIFILPSYALDQIKLIKPPQISVPNVENDRVKISVSFFFNKSPVDYVVYYDRFQKSLVIDLYSALIVWNDLRKNRTTSYMLEVRNVDTEMSLTGQKGQIRFSLEKGWDFEFGWHCEYFVVSPNILQLILWKDLDPNQVVKKKK
jgi:hypothetical protein